MGRLSILKIAFASLAAHKLRTALTTLGIIFGVAAVVSMLSIGEGAKEEALEQIRLLGTNTLLVRAAEPPEGRGEKQESSRTEGLNRGDLRNILRLDGVVEAAAPQRREAIKRAFYADREAKVDVLATTPDFLHVSGADIGEGRFLSHADDAGARRVCVLGYAVRRELFPFESPVGKTIKMSRDYFSVVGVMAHRPIGKSRIEGLKIDDLNRQVYVPLGSAEQRIERGQKATDRMTVMGMGSFSFGGENAPVPPLDEISVRITREDWVASASRVIERMLLRRHRGVRDFEVTVPDVLLRQSQRTQRIFNIVMGSIAGISLVVGGIGIMNIMLATVLERTHEIGVRRAVGARRSDILTQFMSEAVAISLLGSIAGVALGFGMAKGIAHYAQWRTIVSIDSILLAVGVAAGVGLLFGIYPARQAAMLDPIEAVRYE